MWQSYAVGTCSGSGSEVSCSLLRSSISHASTDAATARMPTTVIAPMTARSASMTLKKPPPSSSCISLLPLARAPRRQWLDLFGLPLLERARRVVDALVAPALLFQYATEVVADAVEALPEDPLDLVHVLREIVASLRDTGEVRVDDVLGRRLDEQVETEEDDRHVVELADDRNEIRDEIDRHEQVADDPDEDELLRRWHAAVARQPPHQARVGRQLAHRVDGAADV